MPAQKLIKIGLSALMGVFFLIACYSPVFAQVKINEFVVEPNPEWVEFYNASDSAEYLKSYWLDDDREFNNDDGSSSKKSLSNLNISSSKYPFLEISSFLNNSGDWVVLFDNQGQMVDSYQYTSGPGSNVALGRSPDETGNFYILQETTQGRANAQSIPSPSPSPSPSVSPSPSPSPSPLPSPSPFPTPKPSKSPSPKPSPSPEEPTRTDLVGEATPTGEILGEAEASPPAETKKKNSFTLSFILIGMGIVLLAITGFVFYNQNHERKI